MAIKFQHLVKTITILLPALLVTACAGGGAAYRPIVDAPNSANYERDLHDCQHLAEQRKYVNSDTKTGAAVGAAAGGVVGAVRNNGDDFENIATGAAIGAVVGGGGAMLKTRDERKQIVMRCMSGRGYRVIG